MKFSQALRLSILGMIWTSGIGVESRSTRNLLVGAYSGNLTTLIFDPSKGTLEISPHTAESYMPSWQTLFASPSGKKYILSASRGEDRETSRLTVWEVDKDGALKFTSQTANGAVPAGPVSIAARKDGLVVAASYVGGGVSSFALDLDTGHISPYPTSNFLYTLSAPGPISPNQDTAHPHQALFDPTSKFVVVPDIGADLIRTYSAISASNSLAELDTFHSSPGVGPRHGVFSPSGTQYYQLNELGKSIDVFDVSYTPNIALTHVQNISVFPTNTNTTVISDSAAAEIVISGDGRFLYVSIREDGTFPDALVAPPPSNQTIVSDSFSAFSIKTGGVLAFLGQSPVGGRRPRQFSLDPKGSGDYIAVPTQDTGRVAIYKRDNHSGKLGSVPVASIDLPAFGLKKPVCVTWLD